MSKALDLFFFFGRPFSPIYGALMKARENLYQKGRFSQHSLPVPVISVGNLVLGGTGKTPTVQYIARLLQHQGYHPAIVSRGYRARAREKVNIVSDHDKVNMSAAFAGDEPSMLAAALPGVPVLTGRRRFFPCRYAIDQLACNVIILDDAFQHLAVKRDVDVVLFDSTVLAGSSRIFPGGPLREPVSALKRCHAFLLTGANEKNKERRQRFSNLLEQRFPNRPVFTSSAVSGTLATTDGTYTENSANRKFFGFCGIANPARFKNSLVDTGLQLVGFQALLDHTVYDPALLSRLCARAVTSGADSLVTTAKDLVKLQHLPVTLPLHVLVVEPRIEQAFDHFLLNALSNLKKESPDER